MAENKLPNLVATPQNVAHGVIVRSVNELPSRDTRRTKCKTEPVVQPKTARRGSKEIETALRNMSLSQAGCNRLA